MASSKHDNPTGIWQLSKLSSSARGNSNSRSAKKPPTPTLYYKCQTETSSATRLTLHLTDLVTLHSCYLSKQDIIDEATRSHSPIDPTSGGKQFDVLLNYLLQGLKGDGNVLARDDSDQDGNDDPAAVLLKLRTTTPLPAPLPELTFTFTLRPQSPTELSKVLTLPMIEALRDTKTQNEGLLEVIRDKDHVIERLLERVTSQVQGDMSLVFPVLTGSKDRTMREAERRVKGLKAWEKVPWQEKIGVAGGEGLEVFEGVLGHKTEDCQFKDGGHDWLSSLLTEDVLYVEVEKTKEKGKGWLRRQSTQKSEVDNGTDGDDSATESEDEFERQKTPPSARKTARALDASPSPAASKHNRTKLDDDTDESEDEPPSKKRKHSPAAGSKKGGKLGAIGRKRKEVTSPQRSRSSSPEASMPKGEEATQPVSRRTRRRSSASTASEATGEDGVAPTTRSNKRVTKDATDSSATPSPSPPPRQKVTPSKPSRLGGLKNKSTGTNSQQAFIDSDQPAEAASASPPPSSKGTPSRRLGRLNARKQPERDAKRTPSPLPEAVDETGSSPKGSKTNTPHRLGKLGLRRKNANDEKSSSQTISPAKAKDAISEKTDNGDEETEDEDGHLDLDGSQSTRQVKTSPDKHTASRQVSQSQHNDDAADKKRAEQAEAAARKKKQQDEEQKQKEEETPEQAAQRRREELKKTVAAAPARKKRRF